MASCCRFLEFHCEAPCLYRQILFCLSVHIFCLLVTRLISGLILVRHSLNHLILLLFSVRGTTRFEIYAHYTPSFRAGLPRTVCGSVCLSVEKMTPFVFDISAIDFDFAERMLRRITCLRYSPLHVTAICDETRV